MGKYEAGKFILKLKKQKTNMFIEIALFLVLVYAIATRLGPGAWLWHFVVHDEVLFCLL